MVNDFPIGESGKMGYTQVNAYILVTHWQLLRSIDFTNKNDIPVLTLSLHSDGLECPLKRSMKLYPYVLKFGKPDMTIFHLNASDTSIGDTVIAVLALEAGIARFFCMFSYPSEKGVHCQIHTSADIL